MGDETQGQHDEGHARPDSGRLAMGVAIISLGVLLLLDHAGVIDWGTRTGWWPLLAIIFGVTRLATGGVRSGAFWILIGGWGLLNEYGVVQFEDSWPLLLVIAGGSMVLGSFSAPRRRPVWETGLSRDERRAARRERRWSGGGGLIWVFIMFWLVMSAQGRGAWNWDWNGRRETRTETTDTVHRAAVMGQTRSVSHATAFHGGDLTAIMGQTDLDLTQATVAPGETPVLNVFVVMGQATVRVPDSWIVDTRAVPALGAVRDTRPDQSSDAAAERTHLVLRGAITMGELLVKD